MTSGQEYLLTTTKINRLFRTLRSKCATLAATQQKPSSVVTYSNSWYKVTGRIAEAANPPLIILPRPENIISLHKSDVDNIQHSKKIYDVSDTFKNILQAAFGVSKGLGAQKSSRFPSLAATCASIIGHELEQAIWQGSEDEQHDTNNVIAMKSLEEIYEFIPLHHRRSDAFPM